MYSTALSTGLMLEALPTTMGRKNSPLWMASASLSGISMLNSCVRKLLAFLEDQQVSARTSSIAITTSTVSRLSSPRSFAKCDVAAS